MKFSLFVIGATLVLVVSVLIVDASGDYQEKGRLNKKLKIKKDHKSSSSSSGSSNERKKVKASAKGYSKGETKPLSSGYHAHVATPLLNIIKKPLVPVTSKIYRKPVIIVRPKPTHQRRSDKNVPLPPQGLDNPEGSIPSSSYGTPTVPSPSNQYGDSVVSAPSNANDEQLVSAAIKSNNKPKDRPLLKVYRNHRSRSNNLPQVAPIKKVEQSEGPNENDNAGDAPSNSYGKPDVFPSKVNDKQEVPQSRRDDNSNVRPSKVNPKPVAPRWNWDD